MKGLGILNWFRSEGVVDSPDQEAIAAAIDPFASEQHAEGVPTGWRDQALKAWKYYKEEPIVNNCVNAWRTLALGEDFMILVAGNETLQKELNSLSKRLKLKRWLKDSLLQLLVKGEAAGFKVYGGEPTGKTDDGKDQFSDFAKVKVLNPAELIPTMKDGELTAMHRASGAVEIGKKPEAGEAISLEHFRRWIWDAPEFNEHGTSMILPAFEAIELLRDYRAADRAIAKRWAMPIRLIRVGGQYGRETVMPTAKQLKDIKKTFDSMNHKQGAVVPFYVEVKTYGAEGETLKTEEKIKEAKSDIIVGMGFTRALVSGDGGNYSTASMGFAKVQLMLADLRDIAQEMVAWVIEDYLEMKGHKDVEFQVVFPGFDLSSGADQKKVLVEMYDRGLISTHTLQTMIGLKPDIERSQMETESKKVTAPLKPGDIVGLAQQGMITNEQVAFLLNLAERLKDFGGKKEVPEEEAAASLIGDVGDLYSEVDLLLKARAEAAVREALAKIEPVAA